jgi:hypothetical protein
MIAHGSDCGLLLRSFGAAIEEQQGKRPMHLWF